MKILLVQDYLRSGGTERQTILLAGAFAESGHQVQLLSFRPGGPLSGTLAPAVEQRALQGFDTRLDWFAPGLRRATRRAAPDIILCMGRMANCYAGWIAAANPAALTLATLRTGKPLPLLARHSLARVAHIVANSEAARATLQDRYAVPPARISVIPNALVFPPLPQAEAQAARAALRREHGASEHTQVLLDCAMFRPEKNQAALIRIAAALPSDFAWQLWLVGSGEKIAECRALAARLGVADRVLFFGFVADPRPFYAAADIAVHASRSESLCNFLLEAQAAGLPAIAAQAQGIEECLSRPGESGVVLEQGDLEGFRRAILHYASAAPAAGSPPQWQSQHPAPPPAQAYLSLFTQLLSKN